MKQICSVTKRIMRAACMLLIAFILPPPLAVQKPIQISVAMRPAYMHAVEVTAESGSGVYAAAGMDGAYTIAWLSDTQHYHGSHTEIFSSMTQYLKKSRAALNIGYIAFTGDIVGSGGSKAQWENARAAVNEIEDIPNGVLAGNHDYAKETGLSNYKAYFGEEWYRQKSWYGGSYEDNRNHYDLITLGKTQYLFVYLSYQPGEEDIVWANGIFAGYPERMGVLLTHDYLDGNANLRSNGDLLQREIVSRNPNIYLVLCGHRYTEDTLPAQFDDNGDGTMDRTVYQCIANYQNLGQGGGGHIRFLRIDEAKGTIRFYTYSPYLGVYRTPPERAKNPKDTWTIPWRTEKQANAAA